MSSKLFNNFREDPRLDKQIGCMRGFFRIFDRKPTLRTRNPSPQKHPNSRGRRIAVTNSSKWDTSMLASDCLDSEPHRSSFDSFLEAKASVQSKGLRVSQSVSSKEPPRASFDSKEAAQLFSYYRDRSRGSVVPEGNAKCFLEAVEAKKSKIIEKDHFMTLFEDIEAPRSSLDFEVHVESNSIKEVAKLPHCKKEEQEPTYPLDSNKKLGNTLKPMEPHNTSADSREASKASSEHNDSFLQNLKSSASAEDIQPPRTSADMKECLRVLAKLRDAGWNDFVQEPPRPSIDLKEAQLLSKEPPRHSCNGWQAMKPLADLEERIPKRIMEPPRHSVDGSFPLHDCRNSWLVNLSQNRTQDDQPRRSFDTKVSSKSSLGQNVSAAGLGCTESNQKPQSETKRRTSNVIARLMGLEEMPVDSTHQPKLLLKKPSTEAKLLQALLLYQAPQNPNQTKMLDQTARKAYKKPLPQAGKNKMSTVVQSESSRIQLQAGNKIETDKWQDELHGTEHQMLHARNHSREVNLLSSKKQETVPKSQTLSSSVQKTTSLLQDTADIRDQLSLNFPNKTKSASRASTTFHESLETYSKKDCIRRWSETKRLLKLLDAERSQRQNSEHFGQKEHLFCNERKTCQYKISDKYMRLADSEHTKKDNHVCGGSIDSIKFAPDHLKCTIPGYQTTKQEPLVSPKKPLKAQELAHGQPNQLIEEAFTFRKRQGTAAANFLIRPQPADLVEMEFEMKPVKVSSSTEFVAQSHPSVIKDLGSTGSCSKNESKPFQKMKKVNSTGNLRKDKGESRATLAMQSHISRANQRPLEAGRKPNVENKGSCSLNATTPIRDPEPSVKSRTSQVLPVKLTILQPLHSIDNHLDSRMPTECAESEMAMSTGSNCLKPKVADTINVRDRSKSDNVLHRLIRNSSNMEKGREVIHPGFETFALYASENHQVQETGREDTQSTGSSLRHEIDPIHERPLGKIVRVCDDGAKDHCLENHDLPARFSVGPKPIEVMVSSELQTMSKYDRESSFHEPVSPNSENEERLNLPVAKNLEGNEQPSPVSVLDSLFHDENSPRSIYNRTVVDLPDGISNKSLETSYGSQTEKAPGFKTKFNTSKLSTSATYDTFEADFSIISTHQIERSSLTCKDNWKSIDCRDESMESLRVMLLASGFVEVDAILLWWQYLDFPSMADISDSLKKGGKSSSAGSRKKSDLYTQNLSKGSSPMSKKFTEVNEHLHLACLSELLAKKLLPCIDTYSHLLKRSIGRQLLEQAWAELHNTSCLQEQDDNEMIFRSIERDLTVESSLWHHCNIEIAEMSSKLERMILEDILHEVILDRPITAANVNTARTQRMEFCLQGTPLNTRQEYHPPISEPLRSTKLPSLDFLKAEILHPTNLECMKADSSQMSRLEFLRPYR
ncbi:hypothetical protein O6H91_17G015100 [Diphasiastrum complanatum]|uniref:Uncharacterized protein n=5 Tax=Diphasiastrum complanatum TaxID=34168 RepID=A0ACC2B5H6_DIPCM|nr:hypothetical protein O6H91_17G015100 [Diphasiastrum complanatum]KAJ7524657.1 hypothetical protein O6H91_17G015100 [Diphasiastrum complanatum]KAJ7524658.1 hypothetical protein O6H91_17G015100 [Diphasiastrum complanatum]KAJ7524659.1 hypothetical protein O6H91_17G015100 [Diphasiastrum complanatum]KAJ7524660.1 hypothetical protein O6H91_17G015100 [Diphasiastrum complanatum]